MQLNEAFEAILSGVKDTVSSCGFKAVSGTKENPWTTDGEHSYIDFSGDRGKIRIDIFGNQAVLYTAAGNPDELTDDELSKASTNYFNPEEFDLRDIKSLCNEFNETVETKFSEKSASVQKSAKLPATVSKAAIKSGSQYYDTNTLASRLSAIYPELKAPYKENFEKYGEFLAEEFFEEYGAAPVINTIRNGSDQEMKKLFKALNEIYEDGSSDVQGVIAVTILGKMDNDESMCARAAEYMCDDMRELVLLINKELASSRGAKLKEKMKNPPAYKPKKKKSGGILSDIMAAGSAQGGMPPM